jgi:diadenosine tetraphosphate (Ap4A) HIT family hydrolase
MSNRTRKTFKQYYPYTLAAKQRPCEFCQFNPKQKHFVKEYDNFWVVRNLFPFDVWDTSDVTDHLLVVPKRHIDSVGHFNTDEQAEYAKIIGAYDLKGYASYARPKGSMNKSVPHQHTHLMTYGNKRKKLLIYIKRPYFLWYR